jgi:hypothetical protein
LGGCVIAVGRLQRPDTAGAIWFIGTEPEIGLSPPDARTETSLVLTVGVASSDDLPADNLRTDYVVFALGLRFVTPLLGRHVYFDGEAGVGSVRESDGLLSGVGAIQVTPRLAAGVQYRF